MAKTAPTGQVRPSLVTISTLTKRVRRALARDGLLLQKNRPGSRAFAEVGEFCVLGSELELVRRCPDIFTLARDLGAIKDGEAFHGLGRYMPEDGPDKFFVTLKSVKGSALFVENVGGPFDTHQEAVEALLEFEGGHDAHS